MSLWIEEHHLQQVPQNASPNHGGIFAEGLPDAIVVHFTGGASAESSVGWLTNSAAKASAHVVIGRDGGIVQLVPFNVIAWHAGRSSYGGRSGYNRFSIGIELDNPGRLRRTEGGRFISHFNRFYEPDDVLSAVHRNESVLSYWLTYTEAQLDSCFGLCSALCATYPIREILGHEEIAPSRKDDPGPAFPLERFRQRLIARDRHEDGAIEAAQNTCVQAQPGLGRVVASRLNFRSAPGISAALAAPPLPRHTLVTLLSERDGWYQVRVDGVIGWLKAEYVRAE